MKISSKKELEKILDETDLTYLGYYYKEDSEDSEKGAFPLKNISEKLEYLAGIILIDCSLNPEDFENCKLGNQEKEDRFPVISIFVPPELKFNPYTKKMNRHYERLYDRKEYSENLAYSFLTSNILNKGSKLDSDNIQNFLENSDYNKLILFTDKKQTPLIFRGLSNYFYNQLLFGEIEKEQTALIKKFGITKFPTLMIYKTQEDALNTLDEPELEFYKGKVNAKEIVEFLTEFALPSKKYLNKEGILKTNFKNIKTIDEDFLKKNKEKRIILLMESEENKKISDSLNKIYMETHGFFSFFKILCDESNKNICRKINKKFEFPGLFLLNKDSEKMENLQKFFASAENLPLESKDLQEELSRTFTGEMNIINPTNYQMSMAGAIAQKKVPILYFSKSEIPLPMNLISSDKKFSESVSFFYFQNPSQEIMKNFNIESLPELTIILDDPSNPGK